MVKTIAIVKFIDGLGRLVALTATNEAALVKVEDPDRWSIGDEIWVEREEGHRRAGDWNLAK